ncbi:MAG: SEL1-like repeat protein [Candidatus Korobacteraceae bacterium]|jgi:TPR repeat protein
MKRRLLIIALLLACAIAAAQESTTNELRRRALLGDVQAETGLGLLYKAGGGGVQQNDVTAVYWFRQAAEQGYAPGQYNLGVMYRNGQGGLPKDESSAVHWYRLAADQEFAPAQNNLAWILTTSANPQLRNPGTALEFALKAVAAARNWKNPGQLCMYQDTLAEIYYELGRYESAVRTEEEALTLLSSDDKNRTEYEGHLTKYRRALAAVGKPGK